MKAGIPSLSASWCEVIVFNLVSDRGIRITCEYKADYNLANLKLEITVEQHNQSSYSPPTSTSNQDAIAQWEDKLAFLQREEAITSDSSKKYDLRKQIEQYHQVK
jgi:hypothetical protein